MKLCTIKLPAGEKPQYGIWIKADMGRRRGSGEEDRGRRSDVRGLSGSREYGVARWGGRSRSDSASWRKDGMASGDGKGRDMEKREEINNLIEGNKLALLDGPYKDGRNKGAPTVIVNPEAIHDGKGMDVVMGTEEGKKGEANGNTEPSMRDAGEVDGDFVEHSDGKKKDGKKYKKVPREKLRNDESVPNPIELSGKKHNLSDDGDEERQSKCKKNRKDEVGMMVVIEENLANSSAGLQEQPRRDQ
jgi:hypothetical protein